LDIERIEAAGLLQRVQAVIADALQEGRVGIEQAVEPVDQDAGREQVEQGAVAPGFAPCRRLRRRQPFGAGGRLARWLGSGWLARRLRYLARHDGLGCSLRVAIEPRRQLAGQLVEGVILARRQRERFSLADRSEWHNVWRRFHGLIQIGWW